LVRITKKGHFPLQIKETKFPAYNKLIKSVTEKTQFDQKVDSYQSFRGLPDTDKLGLEKNNLTKSGDNNVSYQAIVEYLRNIWRQYQNTNSRAEKTTLLDEVTKNTHLHRKSVIRLFKKTYEPRLLLGRKGGLKIKYSHVSRFHLEQLWREMGYMCAERMKAALPEWIEFYDHKDFNSDIKTEILKMSISSIKRFLKPARSSLKRKMNTGTRRVRQFLVKVPIRNLQVTPTLVGHCEIDTVAHCGGSLSGEFAWTLTLTDIASGWTECEAMWGKSSDSVYKALKNIESRLPFKIIALYMDNGCEFMNTQIIDKYAKDKRLKPIEVYRSRPYHKNDQSYVEQKNYTHVRHLFGYNRMDWKEGVKQMNSIYRKEWSNLQNFFMPQQKLVEKFRIGSRIIRKLSAPITPIQRLQEYLDPPEYNELIVAKAKLNPIWLRRNQRHKVKYLNKSISAHISEYGRMAT
jgi:hypothetical protein